MCKPISRTWGPKDFWPECCGFTPEVNEFLKDFNVRECGQDWMPVYVRRSDRAKIYAEQIQDMRALGINLTLEKAKAMVKYPTSESVSVKMVDDGF